ncbi:hypothetical protein D3C87_1770620 [compost metagenome]
MVAGMPLFFMSARNRSASFLLSNDAAIISYETTLWARFSMGLTAVAAIESLAESAASMAFSLLFLMLSAWAIESI